MSVIPPPPAYPPPPPPPPVARSRKPGKLAKGCGAGLGVAALVAVLAGIVAALNAGKTSPTEAPAPTTEAISRPAPTSAPPTPEPTPSPTPPTASPERDVVTFAGKGKVTTAPQNLAGGDYVIQYRFGGDCVYFASLKGTTNGTDDLDIASADSATSGETRLYGVAGGASYVEMNTGPPPRCPWTLTFTRQ